MTHPSADWLSAHMDRLRIGTTEIVLLSLVKGLESNIGAVGTCIREERPDIIALPIADEAIEALTEWDGNKKDIPLSTEDILYLQGLRRFGEANLPPPEYVSAIADGKKEKMGMIGLDMDEDTFSKLFCDKVSVFELWRRGGIAKKLMKKEIIASSPEEYAKAWEALLSKNKGVLFVEKAREEHIASSLVALSPKHSKVLAIIEYERREGILSQLQKGKA